MIREERVKREKRVQILGASACAEAYSTGVSGNCLVLSALMRFLFLVFIKSFSLFKRYCPQGMPLHFISLAPTRGATTFHHASCMRGVVADVSGGHSPGLVDDTM